jgi:hypothetical protein
MQQLNIAFDRRFEHFLTANIFKSRASNGSHCSKSNRGFQRRDIRQPFMAVGLDVLAQFENLKEKAGVVTLLRY